MTFFWILLGVFGLVAVLLTKARYASFTAQKPQDYEGEVQQFDLRKHLNGSIECEGVIFGPFGRVSSRFVAEMDVTWDGNVGTMKERFHYDSGSVQNREWRLTVGNDGLIKAEASDVIGLGLGQQCGSAVQLKYRIKLAEEAGGHVLDTTDWMYLVDNGTIMNRSQFRKFGVKVAELVATMRPKLAA